jgi:urease accessory protein
MNTTITIIAMSTNQSFYTLLQIADSIFPIGSYTQSNGLETYVQKEIVKDANSAEAYLKSVLWNSSLYSDFLAVKLAYEYAEEQNIEKIFKLDELLYAVKAPREMKQGSSKMCGRFIKLVEKFNSSELVLKYKDAIKIGMCTGQHSIVFGIFAAVNKIPKEQVIKAYLYNTASCIINNCAKLIPLGQIDGQLILFNCQELLNNVYVKLDDLTIEDIGRCSIGFDIRAMQHEMLYSRLYMS